MKDVNPGIDASRSETAPLTEDDGQAGETIGVGLSVTPANADSVFRETFRATQKGFAVVIATRGEIPAELLSFAEQTGASQVETDGDVDPKLQMVARAKNIGVSRMILGTESGERIDYDRSLQALRRTDSFAVPAVPERAGRAATVAGVPAYNEEGTIGEVVEQIQPLVDEVIVVDDGSTDDTGDVARNHGATVVNHARNRGYGAALQTLFEAADDRGSARLVVLDADGQHDPAQVTVLLDHYRDTAADIVIGSRFLDGGSTDAPVYRRLGIQVVNVLTNLNLGNVRASDRITDTQSGFRVYGRRAIESLADDRTIGTGMSASVDILHRAKSEGLVIEECGADITYDVEDASTQHPLTHGWLLVSSLLYTIENEHPILFLGVPGFASTLIGVGFGYWAILNYIQSFTLPVGLVLVSTTLGLAGLFACFTAIILHALNRALAR